MTSAGGASMVDAIVVGGGHNGLVAAILLAKAGWSVQVLERNEVCGGAVRTAEVTLPGFRHDLFATNLNSFAGSAFGKAFGRELEAHGLRYAHSDRPFSSVFPDGSWVGVSTDLEATLARIRAISPPDAETWGTLASHFPANAESLLPLLGEAMPSMGLVRGLVRAFRHRGFPWLRDVARLAVTSTREFGEEHFADERLRVLFGTWGMHLDYAPDVAGGAVMAYVEAFGDQQGGMVVGQGGAATLIEALVSLLRSYGGEVRTGAEVDAIELQGDRARGVRLTTGERFEARRAVICNLHPRLVFEKLAPGAQLPAAFVRGLHSYRQGPGTMMIHLALSDLPPWRASDELRRWSYVHVAPDFSTIATAYAEAVAGRLPEVPVLIVGQPTTVDPSRAPEGRHILWVQVRPLPHEVPGGWDGAKEAYADALLARLEGFAPGLSQRILARHVLSPADLERYNPNLIGGDSVGGSHHLRQYYLFRPVPGWSRYATPVHGLHLVGASTWPGAGVGAGSGWLLGRMLTGAAR